MTAAKYIVEVNEFGDVFWLDYDNPDYFHRLDGLPAVEFADGYKAYWENDKRHRIDGPAIVYSNGDVEYWIEGANYFYEEWLEKVSPKKEMTIAEIESVLGYSIKIVK